MQLVFYYCAACVKPMLIFFILEGNMMSVIFLNVFGININLLSIILFYFMFIDLSSRIQPLDLRIISQKFNCCASVAQHILTVILQGVIKLNVILPSAIAS